MSVHNHCFRVRAFFFSFSHGFVEKLVYQLMQITILPKGDGLVDLSDTWLGTNGYTYYNNLH